MSRRAALSLALIALALLAYVLAFERGSATSTELSARASRVLTHFVRDKVDRLEIQRRGQSTVLVRTKGEAGEPGSFRVEQPSAAPADADAVDALLGELEWLTARRVLESLSPEDERQFGLSAPRFRVTFQIGRDRYVLALGHGDVHGDGVYAKVAGEPRAYVVPKSLLELLDREPSHYRDKQLFPELTPAWATRASWKGSAGSVALTKQADRWWLGVAPEGFADSPRVRELLTSLAELRATRYVSAPPTPDAGTSSPGTRIEVQTVPDDHREDQRAHAFALELLGSCPGHGGERYARASVDGTAPTSVCVRDEDAKALAVGAAELRHMRLFELEAAAIERVELVHGSTRVTLQREKDDWRAEGATPIDGEAVQAWLSKLALARATRVSSLAPFAQVGSLTLQDKDQRRASLTFSAPTATGELLVRRGDEPVVVSFPSGVADLLAPAAQRFLPLAFWAEHQPSQVVRVTARAAGRTRVISQHGGAWQVEGQSHDPLRLRELVRALLDARALVHVSDRPRPEHGLDADEDGVELTLEQGRTLRLELGARTAQGAYAWVDRTRVVEVDEELRLTIAELAGREAPRSPNSHDEHDGEEDHEHLH